MGASTSLTQPRHYSESLREIYNFYRDNVTFTLSRELQRKQQNGVMETDGSVLQASSDIRDYIPFDGENKWVLKASVEVTDEKEGPLVQRGIEELLKVQSDLAGLYEFSILDRAVLDTRVPAFLEQLRRRLRSPMISSHMTSTFNEAILPLLCSRKGEPTGERDGDRICNGRSEKSKSQNKAYFSGRRNTVHAAHPVHITPHPAEYRRGVQDSICRSA
jgi:hypothetical protein